MFKSMRYSMGFAVCMLFYTQFALAGLPDFTKLVKEYGDAVVNISTVKKSKNERKKFHEGAPLPDGTPFDEYLRRFFGEQERGAEPREARSLGSGFIISEDGYLLTNHHVIKDADEILVRLQDRRQLVATLIGSDKRSDIALLKIDANDLPEVKLGSSDDLNVGEWVLAIGSPFGFDHTVTAGIVSAKGRSLPKDNYVPFIQTDVAINPGNSGGPLFNMDGEVVGINSQIYSRTGGFMGLSFAIPMEVVMNVVAQLKDQGFVSRGWLGVQVQDVTRELAESFGMDTPKGALVAKVLVDSPAEKADFRVGDVIIEFDNKKINTSAVLPPLVGMTSIGTVTKVKVIRQGRHKILEVKIGLLPEQVKTQLAREESSSVTANRLGLVVTNPTIEQRELLDVGENGVLIESVGPGPGRDAGMQRGDVILRIDTEIIDGQSQFLKVIKKLPANKSISVLVQRRGSPFYLAVKLDE